MALTEIDGDIDPRLHSQLQPTLFGSGPVHCRPVQPQVIELDERSSVLFTPQWVQGSDALFDGLRSGLAWTAMERPMYDRVVAVPRLICTVPVSDLPANHDLLLILCELEKLLSVTFSSIGANFYRTGKDSVAWHKDSIKRTRRPSTVALVSLGSPRTLALRPAKRASQKGSKTAETTRSTPTTRRRWRIGNGDLLVMTGDCQRDWEHSVPKEHFAGPRISLAFRSEEAAGGPRLAGAGVPPLLASHKLR